LQKQINYERESKEKSYRTTYSLHFESFPNKKKESVLFITSNKHSGDFVRDMIGRA